MNIYNHSTYTGKLVCLCLWREPFVSRVGPPWPRSTALSTVARQPCMKLTCELCVICHTVQLAASDCDPVIVTARVHATTIDVRCFVPNGFQMTHFSCERARVLSAHFVSTFAHNSYISALLHAKRKLHHARIITIRRNIRGIHACVLVFFFLFNSFASV